MVETAAFEVDGKIIGYEEAIDWEDDFLQKKNKHDKNLAFLRGLHSKAASLKQLVAFHLKVDPRRIECDVSNALQGGFNTALAVQIRSVPEHKGARRRDVGKHAWPQEGDDVIIRFPTPANCGEDVYPGSILEKMRCEVAMYMWIQRHCPDIRIPFLYGFGYPDGRHVRFFSFLLFVKLSTCPFVLFVTTLPAPLSLRYVNRPSLPMFVTFPFFAKPGFVCAKPLPASAVAPYRQNTFQSRSLYLPSSRLTPAIYFSSSLVRL